jgi:hypothetical protein
VSRIARGPAGVTPDRAGTFIALKLGLRCTSWQMMKLATRVSVTPVVGF